MFFLFFIFFAHICICQESNYCLTPAFKAHFLITDEEQHETRMIYDSVNSRSKTSFKIQESDSEVLFVEGFLYTVINGECHKSQAPYQHETLCVQNIADVTEDDGRTFLNGIIPQICESEMRIILEHVIVDDETHYFPVSMVNVKEQKYVEIRSWEPLQGDLDHLFVVPDSCGGQNAREHDDHEVHQRVHLGDITEL